MTREPLKLKKTIIYGPVDSRRLGSSLGLNILPTRYKACPFNCAYCQYGFTGREGHLIDSDARYMPTIDQIGAALERAFEDFPAVSYLTFSGNGEPTLHPDFSNIVDRVKAIKNRVNPDIKLAILSNSALVYKADVRDGLSKLDARFMKLDTGDRTIFERFNRPHRDISLEIIIEGLKCLDNIIIQSLFAGGENGNLGDYAIEKWVEKIGEIKPLECHIYSLDRPSADKTLLQADRATLLKIKDKTEKQTNIPVRTF
jgi:wyosine [tRNA(Phe)-imidazoG37] synthetase (radical SAM superfamily)